MIPKTTSNNVLVSFSLFLSLSFSFSLTHSFIQSRDVFMSRIRIMSHITFAFLKNNTQRKKGNNIEKWVSERTKEREMKLFLYHCVVFFRLCLCWCLAYVNIEYIWIFTKFQSHSLVNSEIASLSMLEKLEEK